MKTFHLRLAVSLLLPLALAVLPGAARAGQSDAAFLDHARALFDQGDLYRAEGEVKSFLHFHPGHPRAAEARELFERLRAALAGSRAEGEGRSAFVPWTQTHATPAGPAVGPSRDRGRLMVCLVRFYQEHLRTFRSADSACPSHPNCSEYAVQALKKHGALLGTFIYVDRLWREVTTAGTPPQVRVGGADKHYDPLEWNDYWLTGSGE
ncbi:MAG: membrane protein insertion efficiency factor YidD [Thermodesulfobacteriota bacterium]